MTETEKMLAGKIYDPTDEPLAKRRTRAHDLCAEYNRTPESDGETRAAILRELAPNLGDGAYLQGPVYFDYGLYTVTGKNFYANFNLTVLDCAPVTIGDNVFMGVNCTLVTPVHPFMYKERNPKTKPNGAIYDDEYAKPITIGDNCWLASNVTVIGGVTIGSGCVIGAGSVVTRDIPPDSLAVGNPCRVIRKITEKDSIALKKELF